MDEFPTKTGKTALYRWLSVFRLASFVHVVGLIATTGRPQYVFCTRRGKAGIHEVLLARLLRAWNVPAEFGGPFGTDATLLFDPPVYVENDRGTENTLQIIGRLRSYMNAEGTVLFVTTTEGRRDRVLDRCRFLGPMLLATTYDDAMRGGDIVDWKGNRLPLRQLLNNLAKSQHVHETEL